MSEKVSKSGETPMENRDALLAQAFDNCCEDHIAKNTETRFVTLIRP